MSFQTIFTPFDIPEHISPIKMRKFYKKLFVNFLWTFKRNKKSITFRLLSRIVMLYINSKAVVLKYNYLCDLSPLVGVNSEILKLIYDCKESGWYPLLLKCLNTTLIFPSIMVFPIELIYTLISMIQEHQNDTILDRYATPHFS